MKYAQQCVYMHNQSTHIHTRLLSELKETCQYFTSNSDEKEDKEKESDRKNDEVIILK